MNRLSDIEESITSRNDIRSIKYIFIIEKNNGYIALHNFAGLHHNLSNLVEYLKYSHNGSLTAIKVVINGEPTEWNNVDIICSTTKHY